MTTESQRAKALTEAELLSKVEQLGIDIDAHRCGCEACLRTSQLCPATLSSLAQEVVTTSAHRSGEIAGVERAIAFLREPHRGHILAADLLESLKSELEQSR